MSQDVQDRPARQQRLHLAKVRPRRPRRRSGGHGRHNNLDQDRKIRRKIFPHGKY